jgi:hypothetical protein
LQSSQISDKQCCVIRALGTRLLKAASGDQYDQLSSELSGYDLTSALFSALKNS